MSSSPQIAEEAIARDYEEDDSPSENESESDTDGSSTVRQFSMINSYQRPSYMNPGARATVFSSSVPSQNFPSDQQNWKKHSYLSKKEREAVREQERSLLRDNDLLPPKHPRRESESGAYGSMARKLSLPGLRKTKSATADNRQESDGPNERNPLLGDPELPYAGLDTSKTISQRFDEAVVSGRLKPTWQRETKVLLKSSAPLILTFLLQYSLPVASIFTVGHIGKIELGAVSLASSKFHQSAFHVKDPQGTC
jgi:MATE family multidrug resistance protein